MVRSLPLSAVLAARGLTQQAPGQQSQQQTLQQGPPLMVPTIQQRHYAAQQAQRQPQQQQPPPSNARRSDPEQFGITTNYDEGLYTTKLDRSRPDFRERERRAW
jgi:hypothetical protein